MGCDKIVLDMHAGFSGKIMFWWMGCDVYMFTVMNDIVFFIWFVLFEDLRVWISGMKFLSQVHASFCAVLIGSMDGWRVIVELCMNNDYLLSVCWLMNVV